MRQPLAIPKFISKKDSKQNGLILFISLRSSTGIIPISETQVVFLLFVLINDIICAFA